MATDEKINDAIQAYLTEQAYGSPVTDGLMIAAEAGWRMLRTENARMRGALTAIVKVGEGFVSGDEAAYMASLAEDALRENGKGS